MKVTKKQLRKIIRKGLLKESRKGTVSLGFAGWEPNRTPDFAKSYGKDAFVIGRYQNNNNDIMEQPIPASGNPEDVAFNKLKMGGAFKELQEMMHDCSSKIDQWQAKHEVDLVDADMEDFGVQLEDARLALENLRRLANQFR